MKNSFIKKLVITFVTLIVLCSGCFLVYVNDYYRCDIDLMDLISNYPNVDIETKENKDIIFKHKEMDVKDCIIFYPGGKVEYTAYTPLMLKLADKGIMCVLLHVPFNLAIFDINSADKYIGQFSEIENYYLAGHSLGGASASMYLEKNIDLYKGLILLGSYSSKDLSNTNLKVISIYGENDLVLNKEKYQENLVHLPSNYQEYVIQGGCHAYFGNYGFQEKDGIPTISSDIQQDLTAQYILDWIK